MSFMANPIPVERPPEMTTSHVLLTWKTASTVSNHVPQTTTCIMFLAITNRVAAVAWSTFSKCSRASSVTVLLTYLNRNYRTVAKVMVKMLARKPFSSM